MYWPGSRKSSTACLYSVHMREFSIEGNVIFCINFSELYNFLDKILSVVQESLLIYGDLGEGGGGGL
jgi:hypothetical protein